ncbi:acyl-CoA N-acyltransferase [Schizophyllum commune H4-8]|uniref:N-acetyltransferase domain-containing protein n=1 Tax=Schizophyllum commune (strain H4-8 / FGSC 9210) TaxID=578458 RepID=D8QH85_SCHCM|nr:acyl-CoA N-acyltransferase [Schizophyllum commune H4-8]KAI5887071.1 acyl-CoA N-acyltransferase [Schizophyllum commune H4-8]
MTASAKPTFSIRAAEPKDIDVILQMIIELAVYEKEPDAVKATPELLRKNLFEDKYANAILAFSEEGQPIGLALYFFNFSTWTGRPGLYLEDLYVKPEFRGSGAGKALFGRLGKIAQEKGCPRLDWSVLKWNQPSIDFYEKVLHAKPMSEWLGMRLEVDGIEALKKFDTSV